LRRIRFSGVRRIGTMNPRHLWRPGEVLEVNDEVAAELLKIPGFEPVKRKKRKKRS